MYQSDIIALKYILIYLESLAKHTSDSDVDSIASQSISVFTPVSSTV